LVLGLPNLGSSVQRHFNFNETVLKIYSDDEYYVTSVK